MLSLKEFCFALYLMERYREGRPLPQSLPSHVLFDETLLSMMGHPKPTYGNAAWGIVPGIFHYFTLSYDFIFLFSPSCGIFLDKFFTLYLSQGVQPQQGMPGARPVAPAAGLRPPAQGTSPPASGAMQPNLHKSAAPVLEDSFLNHTDNGDQNILNSKSLEASTAGKKVFALPL